MMCDYCDEGNVAVEGWHNYPGVEEFGEAYRVPCPKEVWCRRQGHIHISRLCPDEDEAVGDILDGD